MATVNILTGDLDLSNLTLRHTHGDEKFYTVNGTFNDVCLEVVVSEYLIDGLPSGRYNIKCLLGSYIAGDANNVPRIHIFLKAIDLVKVDDTANCTDTVTLEVSLSKAPKFYVTREGTEFLSFFGKYAGRSRDYNAYFLARGQLARKLRSCKSGAMLLVNGRIRHREGKSDEIFIKEANNLEKEND